jgi:hypothetical protein
MITVSRAFEIVVGNGTLTPSARLQIQEKLIRYEDQREVLSRQLENANALISKIEKILEIDGKLKIDCKASAVCEVVG